MSYTRLRASKTDGIGHIELSCPEEFNRMPPAFWEEFPAAVAEMDADGDARVLILSSTGKHFSSGMDLKVFTDAPPPTTRERGRLGEAGVRRIARAQDAFNGLEALRIPVLAAIQGGCIGGGMDMVAACDIRYCTEDAFFCIQEINLGLTADVGTLQRLPRRIPDGIARELAYTAKFIDASRAREIHLINEIFPDLDALMEGARKLAEEIANVAPLAVPASKEVLGRAIAPQIDEGLRYVASVSANIVPSNDLFEAITALTEKRKPKYTGS